MTVKPRVRSCRMACLMSCLLTVACAPHGGVAPPAHSTQAEAAPLPTTASPQPTQMTLRLAEEKADRIVRRLHETLDFGVVVRETFTADPRLRRYALSPFDLDDMMPGMGKSVGEDLPERMYVAFMNLNYMQAAYHFVHGEKLPPEIEAAGGDELWPFFNEDLKLDEHETVETVRRKFEKYVADATRLAGMFRRHLTPQSFDSPRYRERTQKLHEAFEKAGRASRVEEGYKDRDFEMGPGVKVYVVRREAWDYYFVEEGGDLRVFHVNTMPDFKLPGL